MAHIAKILVVDDRESNREIMKYILTKEGYDFYEATNGEEGLERAREIIPDLLILDLAMPVLDGYGMAKEVRKDSRLRGVPIIFSSLTYEIKSVMTLAGEVGAYVMPGEFRDEKVLEIVKKALKGEKVVLPIEKDRTERAAEESKNKLEEYLIGGKSNE